MLKYSWKDVVVSGDKSKICKEAVKIKFWNKISSREIKTTKEIFLKTLEDRIYSELNLID